MARSVKCSVAEDRIDGRPGVVACCGRCGHSTTSFGTGEASVRRCLALLREECPRGEINFYEEGPADDDEEDSQSDEDTVEDPAEVEAPVTVEGWRDEMDPRDGEWLDDEMDSRDREWIDDI